MGVHPEVKVKVAATHPNLGTTMRVVATQPYMLIKEATHVSKLRCGGGPTQPAAVPLKRKLPVMSRFPCDENRVARYVILIAHYVYAL